MEAEEPLPEGWKEVSSRSRPGQVSYLNTLTGRRVMQRPTEPAKTTDAPRAAAAPTTPATAELHIQLDSCVAAGNDGIGLCRFTPWGPTQIRME